jgi:hypothetical protein
MSEDAARNAMTGEAFDKDQDWRSAVRRRTASSWFTGFATYEAAAQPGLIPKAARGKQE